MYVIYKATNIVNQMFYIGATKNLKRRIVEHKCHSKKQKRKSRFYEAICEYGFDNFQFEILKQCTTEEEMYEWEIKLIEQYNATDILVGYNQIKGGRGGQTHDVSGKNNPMFGKKLTQEQKRKMSSKLKGVNAKPMSVINIHTQEIIHFSNRTDLRNQLKINPQKLLKGYIENDKYMLYVDEGQETIESIVKEKNFNE